MNIKNLTSNELLEQYDANRDLVEMCWSNAQDCMGTDMYHYLDEMNNAKLLANALHEEIMVRKASNTLYDGRRAEIKKIWVWAATKADDEKHIYNIVRKIMRSKGVYMTHYRNAI